MRESKTIRRSLALGAATAIGFGGLFVAAPAALANEEAAPAFDAATFDYAAAAETLNAAANAAPAPADAGNSAPKIVGVNSTTTGQLVVLQNKDAELGDEVKQKIAELKETTGTEVIVLETEPLQAYAQDEVVGGAGYLVLGEADADGNIPIVGGCSLGFSTWDKNGNPALLSAGHCAGVEAGATNDVALSLPSTSPAVGGGKGSDPLDGKILGSFSFAQWGGPGNSPATPDSDKKDFWTGIYEPDSDFTDVAVIDINSEAGYTLRPEVTDWTTAASDDLAGSTVKVTAAGEAELGPDVQKAGRTTGWTEAGTGFDFTVPPGYSNSGETYTLWRGANAIGDKEFAGYVTGFATSEPFSAPGDSGGAVLQGNKAVGVISGGNDDFDWVADLPTMLSHTDGHTIQLFLEKPGAPEQTSVTSYATVSGSAPAGAERVVLTREGADPVSIDVVNGEWEFKAPGTPGEYSYSVVSAQGQFNRSEATTFDLEVGLAAPRIDGDGTRQTSAIDTITGSGKDKATVTVSIDGEEVGSTQADENGAWALELDTPLTEVANYAVTAVQAQAGATSAEASATLTIIPAMPLVTSVNDGDSFNETSAPTSIAGEGIEGAAIRVDLAGSSYDATVQQDGTWIVEALNGALEPGDYLLRASQTVNGVRSDIVDVNFTVNADPAPEPEPGADADGTAGAGAEGDSDSGAAGAGTGAEGDAGAKGGDDLPGTGATNNLLPLGLAAGVMLVLGLGATVFAARRERVL